MLQGHAHSLLSFPWCNFGLFQFSDAGPCLFSQLFRTHAAAIIRETNRTQNLFFFYYIWLSVTKVYNMWERTKRTHAICIFTEERPKATNLHRKPSSAWRKERRRDPIQSEALDMSAARVHHHHHSRPSVIVPTTPQPGKRGSRPNCVQVSSRIR